MLVEAPCFSRGKLDFSPAEKEFTLEMGSFPRINARLPPNSTAVPTFFAAGQGLPASSK
jgi:hypothetical protein